MARPKENTERITVFFPPDAIEKMKDEAARNDSKRLYSLCSPRISQPNKR